MISQTELVYLKIEMVWVWCSIQKADLYERETVCGVQVCLQVYFMNLPVTVQFAIELVFFLISTQNRFIFLVFSRKNHEQNVKSLT